MVLVTFWHFLNFRPFFGPFWGTLVENSEHKKVAPGILTLIFGSQNCVFLKSTFSGPQLSRSGLVWYLLNSWKARASRGLFNIFFLLLKLKYTLTQVKCTFLFPLPWPAIICGFPYCTTVITGLGWGALNGRFMRLISNIKIMDCLIICNSISELNISNKL